MYGSLRHPRWPRGRGSGRRASPRVSLSATSEGATALWCFSNLNFIRNWWISVSSLRRAPQISPPLRGMRIDLCDFWQIARLLLSGLPHIVSAFLINKITFNKLRECPVFYEGPERRITRPGKTYLTHSVFKFIKIGSKGGVRGLGQWEATTTPDVISRQRRESRHRFEFQRSGRIPSHKPYYYHFLRSSTTHTCSLFHQP